VLCAIDGVYFRLLLLLWGRSQSCTSVLRLILFGRLLFVEISPEEHQLLSYFGLSKEVLPQVQWLSQ
jgi:hypothetical protein